MSNCGRRFGFGKKIAIQIVPRAKVSRTRAKILKYRNFNPNA